MSHSTEVCAWKWNHRFPCSIFKKVLTFATGRAAKLEHIFAQHFSCNNSCPVYSLLQLISTSSWSASICFWYRDYQIFSGGELSCCLSFKPPDSLFFLNDWVLWYWMDLVGVILGFDPFFQANLALIISRQFKITMIICHALLGIDEKPLPHVLILAYKKADKIDFTVVARPENHICCSSFLES